MYLADLELRAPEGVVNTMVAIAGVVTVGLLVYLVAALMKPEWFA
jgi:K+-transporting ATPase KdpF subunit